MFFFLPLVVGGWRALKKGYLNQTAEAVLPPLTKGLAFIWLPQYIFPYIFSSDVFWSWANIANKTAN
jgi:hypothetical protein